MCQPTLTREWNPVTPAIEQLVERIPHRPPIRCIGRVLVVARDHAESEYVIPDDGVFCHDGRFLPEGMIEALAQAAGVMEACEEAAQQKRSARGMLVVIKDFVIHTLPRSGEVIHFRIDLQRRLGPFTLVRGKATRNGALLAEGTFKFFIEA